MSNKIDELTASFKNLANTFANRSMSKDKNPTIRKQRSKFIKKANESESYEDTEIVKHLVKREKSESDKSFIKKSLANNVIFSALNDLEMSAFVDSMSYYVFSVGSKVTEQGTNGSYFFVINEGIFDVYIDGKLVNTMERGTAFGEISLINDTPRTATVKVRGVTENVKASSDTLGSLWGVNRTVFRETLKNISMEVYSQNRSFLDSVKIFEMLTENQKNMVTNAFVESKFVPGDRIVTQGDFGDVLYIIKEGKADVLINDEKVRTLTNGQYFGERALLYDEPRSATIVATEDTVCVSLGREILNKVLGNLDNVLFRNVMMEYLQNSTVFRQFTPDQLAKLIESASVRDFKPGDVILHREEKIKGIRFFILLEGSVQILYEDNEIGIMERGDSFGEEYVLSPEIPFAHTVKCIINDKRAEGSCKLALLTKHAIQEILGTDLIDEKLDYNNKLSVIKKMYIFRYLSEAHLDMLIKKFKSKRYKKGEYIIREGEVGDSFYIISKGDVDIIKSGTRLRTLGKNDYFGERALLYDEPRTASVVCSSANSDLWVVEKSVFLKIVEDPMLSHLENRIRVQDTKVLFDDLHTVRQIGKGTFGTVNLVVHQPSQLRFALKCVSKKLIVYNKQQKNIKMEKEIMAQNDHPFIIQLVKTFKDEENIYFLTELVTGGELFDALRKLELLKKPQAQFYLGSIILALEYLHERQIIYRDLKPENVMLDHQGYIKLIDFGSAKKIEGRTFTVIGTPQYMAPEVIMGKGYNCMADIWSIGVCLYEFICGPLPFGDDAVDQFDVFKKVLHDELKFPDFLRDQDGINLIKRLLCRKTELRIGNSINGFKDIKEHPYFRDFDWDSLACRGLKPPLIPEEENYNEEFDDEQPKISEQDLDSDVSSDDWEQDF
ncbi:Protein kinase domain protein [Theileria parva strain Muguga]|uniref:Protein kinase domain protein n=1 Tax=Theileria parva strain Muguga TaxID=333668 RepID=UPI001C61A3DB|nr:Protein kinase domain protein [Theileria parva strain Muguga]EAN31256.2 Protein kinase domain protein [Theileria parva strain Muguga]